MVLTSAVFNEHYAKMEPLRGASSSAVKISVISQERKIKIQEGSPFLINKSIPETSDVLFLSHGILSEVRQPRLASFEDLQTWPNIDKAKEVARDLSRSSVARRVYYIHDFIGNHVSQLKNQNNTLDQLAFSLLSVEEYEHPQVHFQAQMRLLPQEDYETVLNGWVYLSRTAFGKLANALPLANRLEFRIRMLKEFKTEILPNLDYVALFGMLYDYIDTRILSRGRLLIETADMLKEVFSDLGPEEIAAIGFASPERPSQGDSIEVQANLFRELFADGKLAVLQQLNEEVIANRSSEDRFNKLFHRKHKQLPLILE